MSRDNVVFATCGLVLGLIIGSLVIGPKVAQSKLAAAPVTVATPAATPAVPASSMSPAAAAAAAPGNPMGAVLARIATLKQAIEKDPKNFEALSQLGNMYMDAGKFPQAIGYYEQALAVREEPGIRTDLGICYKETGQLDKALAQLQQVARERPGQWQTLFNEAVVLVELKRLDEARALGAQLAQMRPDDPAVQKLNQALAAAK
ncbi:MAG: Tetratricopeptide 2 repeat protein [Acidobacteria bacterium]|nr:Tetratricopeptide 2 repeat protein [Acidobacteriota bacterium]